MFILETKRVSLRPIILFLSCLSYLLILGDSVVAQQRIARLGIGTNLATLYSGLPEMRAELSISRYVGVVAGGGYMLHPRRGFVKLDDGVDLHSQQGGYWKIGIKGKYYFKKGMAPVPWLELLYIGSQYHEKATRSNIPSGPQLKELKGIVHGYALGLGWDFPMNNRLDLRVGLQTGKFDRKEHIGERVLTFQPGFGPAIGDNTYMQMILGLSYKFGDLVRKSEAQH